MDLLGATSEASARALGGLFLGLALGAAIAGAWTRRLRRPWRAAGCAELCVAMLSLPMLTLGVWSEPLWPWLGIEGVAGPQGDWLKLILSLLLVVPPATAMGAVLPWVLAAVPSRKSDETESSLGLYALNTAGGILGLLSVAFVLIPTMGARATMVTAIGGNVIAGLTLLIADRQRVIAVTSAEEKPVTSPRLARLPLMIAFVSGFTLLAFEVLSLQALMLVAPLSYHSPAIFLAVVLSALAIGSWWVTQLLRRKHPGSLLAFMAPWCAMAITVTPWLFMLLARIIQFGPEANFATYILKTLLFCLCAFSPALLLSGLVFPLAAAASADPEEQAIPWGWLLAINGLGGWIGAEFAVIVLMPTFGLYRGLGVVGIVMATLGLVLAAVRIEERGSRSLAAMGALVLIAGVTWGPLGNLPLINPHLGFQVVDHRLNREGVVSVVEHESFGRAFLVSNQYLLGSTQATPDQRRQALMPLVLHPKPSQVAFIGVATGITPSAALDVEGVDAITAMEISHSVADMASEHFAIENGGILEDPRTSLVIEDGRTLLTAAQGAYDVVIGDLILPWSPGEGRLYTKEHFASARRSLKPGGLYCQWVPIYQLTREQFGMIARTFCAVFPRAELIRREFGYKTPAVAFVGWQDDRTIDWEIVEKRCQELRHENRVHDPTVRHSAAVEMLYLGSAKTFSGDGPLNTLDHPIIEFDAGRERVTGNPGAKYLTSGRWLRFMTDMVKALDRRTKVAELARLGAQWSELQILRQSEPTSTTEMLMNRTQFTLPRSLLEDQGADWYLWPGDPYLVKQSFTSEGISMPQRVENFR